MASRFKEDEKNERIIRGLLKLPTNKKCINCNSLGPQYVCTNFRTFICTNCSGIHREFTHRVKSVSMAKFTSQEVAALQEGGNEHAKEIFFKEWDQQRHSFPDSSNVERLRTFIKHVYVDRRYTGDRSLDKPPRSGREDSYEQRRPETFRGGSQSPSYDESYDRRYGDRPSPGGRNDDRNSRYSYEGRRSPGYDQGDYRRSPGRFEMADDRRRDDKFGKGNQTVRFEERRISDGASMTDGRSPNNQKDSDVSSSPIVRPVRDILGEDAPALQVGEPPKSNGGRVIESPPQGQRTTASSSSVSPPTGGSPPEVKSVTPALEVNSVTTATADVKNVATQSLIDFGADFEPPVAAPQEQSGLQQSTLPPVDSGNWASFDSGAVQNPTPVTNSNPLDSALAQLYAPGNASTIGNPSILPTSGASTFPNIIDQWPAAQQNENSLFSGVSSQTAIPQSIASQSTSHGVGPSSQPWGASAAPNAIGHFTTSTGQISQPLTVPHMETGPRVPSQAQILEAKPNERNELPVDFFTLSYPMGHGAVPNWQARPHYGMGFGMQYPAAVMQAAPSFSYPAKSANPFDVSSEPTLVHASTFPSMAPLQGALPNNGGPPGLLRGSSLGPIPQWMPQQQLPNPLTVAPGGNMSQVQSNMGQQASGNMFPMGTQGIGDAGNQQFGLGTPEMNQNLNTSYSHQGTSNSFAPVGGNPFG